MLRAVELDGELYLDATPAAGSAERIWPGMTSSDHVIFAAKLEGDRLLTAALDPGQVRKYAADANLRLVGGWCDEILDAPTGELQKFIARYRNEIFEEMGEFRRIAKGPAAD